MPDKPYTLFSNRDLFRLLVPLFIEQLLFIAVGSADAIMVARLGEASISSVSLVDMANVFIGNVFYALSTGGAVVASQFIGAGRKDRARESAWHLLVVSCAVSLVITGLCEAFNRPFLRLLFGELEETVMRQSLTYFRITALAYPFIALYGACAALFRSQNQARTTMRISLLSNLVNITGNAVLIYGFRLGVAGAALATLTAHAVGMSVAFVRLCNPQLDVCLCFSRGFSFSWNMFRRILTIGVPSGIEGGIFQFGRLMVLGLIAKYGTAEIASNAVANQMDYFGIIVGNAFSLGTLTIVGQCVGAGSESQLRYYVRKVMAWAYGAHVAWNLLLFAFMPLILLCYSKLTPSTLRLAVFLIVIHNGLGMLFWPLSFVFPNILRAANDVKYTMCVSVASMLVIRVAGSYLLAPAVHSGAIAVWIAMVGDWILRCSLFLHRYRSGKWRANAHLRP